MSVNWVMLDPSKPNTFTPLPSESTLYTSPPRTALSITSLNKYPGSQPYTVSSSAGTLFLTNRRIIYLSSPSTPQFQSFSAPILNLQDSHVTAPWIGPNAWIALCKPVQGGGIPVSNAVEVKITFKDGGAYDFSSRYERVRERLAQAVETARANGMGVGDGSEGGRRGDAMQGVNVDNVHLEELPRYEDAAQSVRVHDTAATVQDVQQQPRHVVDDRPVRPRADAEDERREAAMPTPDEPPPSYDVVQREVVEDELSRQLEGARMDDERMDDERT
ncbi:hypothetical protein MBLNU457_g0959t1 [Dothideomycetes sp. NU457]